MVVDHATPALGWVKIRMRVKDLRVRVRVTFAGAAARGLADGDAPRGRAGQHGGHEHRLYLLRGVAQPQLPGCRAHVACKTGTASISEEFPWLGCRASLWHANCRSTHGSGG